VGTPESLEQFEATDIDGVTLFVPRNLCIPGELTVVLNKFLWWKWLGIRGWKIL
jgi:hypothetical protein